MICPHSNREERDCLGEPRTLEHAQWHIDRLCDVGTLVRVGADRYRAATEEDWIDQAKPLWRFANGGPT